MRKGARLPFDFVPVLGVMGLAFVILFFLWFSLGGDLTSPVRESDSYSLFEKLFKKLGYTVKVQYSQQLASPKGNLLVYFDDEPDAKNWQMVLNRWVKPGGTVLLAGISGETDPVSKQRLQSDVIQYVFGVKPAGNSRRQSGKKLDLKLKEHYLKHLPYPNHLNAAQVLLDSTHGPLLYQINRGAGRILVLTDSSLLRNGILREGKTAIYFNRLLGDYYRQRIYLMDANAPRQNQPVPLLALLFRGKLGYVTLQLLLLMALFITWQGKRFGNPQTATPYARRALTEHLKAVGNWYQKTGSITMVDEINCGYFRSLIQKVTGLQLQEPLRPEELERLKTSLAARGLVLGGEQLRESLTAHARISLSGLQKKEKMQEQIWKTLSKR